MKKLLSALFILGSVAALGQEAQSKPEHGENNGYKECYTSACSVERKMDIKVSIPTQLKITKLGDIDLGKWCGTKTISKEASYTLEGEKNARVKVYFENDRVAFSKSEGPKHGDQGNAGFTAYMNVDGKTHSYVTLTGERHSDGGLGKVSGKVKATLDPVAEGVKLVAGGKYVATAKLIAEYDSF